MTLDRKRRVAASFSSHAAGYEAAAQAQEMAADRLAAHVRTLPLPPAPRVLEVGCGTGLLTRRLLPVLGGLWTVTDLAPAMVAATAALGLPAADVRVMDGERPDLPEGSVDLIVSNLAAQWFLDLPAALAALRRCLAPGGVLALTTLGAGSFAEWRAAHRRLGLACGVADYPSAAELAERSGAAVVAERIAVGYADGRAFVRALKTIGAAVPVAGHRPLGPAAMKRVLAELGAPCTITYEVLTVDLAA